MSADLISQLGFPVALCLVLLWWINGQAKRWQSDHAALTTRLQQSEDWIRDTLSLMNAQLAGVIRDNTHAMHELLNTNREIVRALRERPCMHDVKIETETALVAKVHA